MKCKNCGASWDGRKCDYCGTASPGEPRMGEFFPTPFGVQYLTPREVGELSLEQRACVQFRRVGVQEHTPVLGQLLGMMGTVTSTLINKWGF